MTTTAAAPSTFELDDLLQQPTLAGTTWSVRVDYPDREGIEHNADDLLPTASVAKVLVLIEVAARIEAGLLNPRALMSKVPLAPVGGAGLWQNLHTIALPLNLVACLVGAHSDNLATNKLIELVGLEAIQRRAGRLGMRGPTLHDIVRDRRDGEHPPAFSTGTTTDWANLMGALGRGEVVNAAVSSRVLEWLTNRAFGGEAMSFVFPDRQVAAKAGWDAGVRAEAGVIIGEAGSQITYAAICTWDATTSDQYRDVAVESAMSQLGDIILGAAR